MWTRNLTLCVRLNRYKHRSRSSRYPRYSSLESKLVEVKSGKAKLSEIQKRTKRKKSNYKVERVNPFFY